MKTRFLAFLMLFVVLVLPTLPAHAGGKCGETTINVTTTADLIQAINVVDSCQNAHVIEMASATSFDLMAPLPVLTNSAALTIDGNGSIISRDNSAPAFGIFVFAGSGSVTINQLGIENGSSLDGGGISSDESITLNNVLLGSNFAAFGGGIFVVRNATLNNCSITGNSASDDGGGIYQAGVGNKIILNNSAVTDNTARYDGGGIDAAVIVLTNNSRVTGNTAQYDPNMTP